MIKEKGVQEGETGTSKPILSTSPAYQRLIPKINSNLQFQDKKGKIIIPNPPRIELPMVSIDKPREWLRNC